MIDTSRPPAEDVQAEVVRFLSERLAHNEIDADTDLITTNLLDSLLLIDLLAHLEPRYAIQVDAGDITPVHFRSPVRIARLVESRRHQTGAHE